MKVALGKALGHVHGVCTEEASMPQQLGLSWKVNDVSCPQVRAQQVRGHRHARMGVHADWCRVDEAIGCLDFGMEIETDPDPFTAETRGQAANYVVRAIRVRIEHCELLYADAEGCASDGTTCPAGAELNSSAALHATHVPSNDSAKRACRD